MILRRGDAAQWYHLLVGVLSRRGQEFTIDSLYHADTTAVREFCFKNAAQYGKILLERQLRR